MLFVVLHSVAAPGMCSCPNGRPRQLISCTPRMLHTLMSGHTSSVLHVHRIAP